MKMVRRYLRALPVALILIALGAWWLGNRVVRPVRAIIATAEKITAEGLGERVEEVASNDEIGSADTCFKPHGRTARIGLPAVSPIQFGCLPRAAHAAGGDAGEDRVRAATLGARCRSHAVGRTPRSGAESQIDRRQPADVFAFRFWEPASPGCRGRSECAGRGHCEDAAMLAEEAGCALR